MSVVFVIVIELIKINYFIFAPISCETSRSFYFLIYLICVPTNYKKKDINKIILYFLFSNKLYNILILDLSKQNMICLQVIS